MLLIKDIINWIVGKCFVVLLLIIIIAVFFFVKKSLYPEYKKIISIEKAKTELANCQNQVTSLEEKIKERKDKRPPFYHPIDRYYYNKQTDFLKYLQKLNTVKQNKDSLEAQINIMDGQINKLFWNIVSSIKKSFASIFYILIFAFLAPFFIRIFLYYCLAPLLDKAPPLQIHPDKPGASVAIGSSERAINIVVDSQHPLFVRENYLKQYDKKTTFKNTKLFWNWRYPFTCYVAGLRFLTKITTKNKSENGIAFISPEDPDKYLMEISLEDHPGLVVYPAKIVGISGNIKIKSQWFIRSIHSWSAGQLRYIIFHGTGKIYLEGYGDVYVQNETSQPLSLEPSLLLCFDSRLSLTTSRTETFFPYFRGKASLVDYTFMGDKFFFSQISSFGKEKDFLTKASGNLWNVIGKLFGF